MDDGKMLEATSLAREFLFDGASQLGIRNRESERLVSI